MIVRQCRLVCYSYDWWVHVNLYPTAEYDIPDECNRWVNIIVPGRPGGVGCYAGFIGVQS